MAIYLFVDKSKNEFSLAPAVARIDNLGNVAALHKVFEYGKLLLLAAGNGKLPILLDKVKTEGDKAVREYEERFDKVKLDSLGVTETEIAEAEKEVPIELKAAIMLAQKNIHTFHSSQRFEGKKVQTVPGVTCWQKAVAIEKVGLYIPGGTAPLFSTVLMLATPAHH